MAETEYNVELYTLEGNMTLTGYSHQGEDAIQLTFNKPVSLYGEKHCDASSRIGYWFMNLSRQQALELCDVLIQYAEGNLKEKNNGLD